MTAAGSASLEVAVGGLGFPAFIATFYGLAGSGLFHRSLSPTRTLAAMHVPRGTGVPEIAARFHVKRRKTFCLARIMGRVASIPPERHLTTGRVGRSRDDSSIPDASRRTLQHQSAEDHARPSHRRLMGSSGSSPFATSMAGRGQAVAHPRPKGFVLAIHLIQARFDRQSKTPHPFPEAYAWARSCGTSPSSP